jgi:hypothetical protein
MASPVGHTGTLGTLKRSSANTTHTPRGAFLATTFTAVFNDIHGE